MYYVFSVSINRRDLFSENLKHHVYFVDTFTTPVQSPWSDRVRESLTEL